MGDTLASDAYLATAPHQSRETSGALSSWMGWNGDVSGGGERGDHVGGMLMGEGQGGRGGEGMQGRAI